MNEKKCLICGSIIYAKWCHCSIPKVKRGEKVSHVQEVKNKNVILILGEKNDKSTN